MNWIKTNNAALTENKYYLINKIKNKQYYFDGEKWYLSVPDSIGRYNGILTSLDKQPEVRCYIMIP